jgi:hypothetical protein
VAGAVLFVVLGVRSGRDDEVAFLPGTAPFVGGVGAGGFALPRELTAFDALVITAPRDGHRYTVLGWSLRSVQPAGTRIAYRVRHLDVGRCPDDHIGFGRDPVEERREGQHFPCPLERVGGQVLRPGRRLAFTAVFWESARPGDVTDMGAAEAVFRRDDGRLYRAVSGNRITSCVVGVRECARWSRRQSPGESVRESLDWPTGVCHDPARTPLFAAPEHRPPRPAPDGPNRDLRGRPCTRAPG